MSCCEAPLYGKPERHAQIDGLELFIVQGGFAFDDMQDSMSGARYLTVLANFNASSLPFFLLSELSGSLTEVLEHCHVVPWEGLRTSVAKLLDAYPASTLNLVVQLPALGRHGITPKTVDDALDGFIKSSKHIPGLFVGIARDTKDWHGMRNLEHFVAAPGPTFDRDVGTLFKALASLMAPDAIAAADAEDFKLGLGNALFPAQLAHATWSHDKETLTFLSAEDQALVAGSESQVLVPFFLQAKVNTSMSLIGEWRKICPDEAFLVLSITWGFYEMALWLPGGVSHVVAVCASGSKPAVLEN